MDPVTENERGELLLALEHVEVKVEPEDDPGSGPKGEESLAASVGTSHQDAMAKLKEGLAEALQVRLHLVLPHRLNYSRFVPDHPITLTPVLD